MKYWFDFKQYLHVHKGHWAKYRKLCVRFVNMYRSNLVPSRTEEKQWTQCLAVTKFTPLHLNFVFQLYFCICMCVSRQLVVWRTGCPAEGISASLVRFFLWHFSFFLSLDASNLTEYTDFDAESKLRKGHVARQKVIFFIYSFFFFNELNIYHGIINILFYSSSECQFSWRGA